MAEELPRLTVDQVRSRVSDIRTMVQDGDHEAAEEERYELLLTALHTISTAPALADKRQMKMLALAALEVRGIEIRGIHGRT